jgi:hypothetical protein
MLSNFCEYYFKESLYQYDLFKFDLRLKNIHRFFNNYCDFVFIVLVKLNLNFVIDNVYESDIIGFW